MEAYLDNSATTRCSKAAAEDDDSTDERFR